VEKPFQSRNHGPFLHRRPQESTADLWKMASLKSHISFPHHFSSLPNHPPSGGEGILDLLQVRRGWFVKLL
jgi:hypothetical protein